MNLLPRLDSPLKRGSGGLAHDTHTLQQKPQSILTKIEKRLYALRSVVVARTSRRKNKRLQIQ
jgi:hypothetical protein